MAKYPKFYGHLRGSMPISVLRVGRIMIMRGLSFKGFFIGLI